MVVVVEGEDFPLEPLNLELIVDAKTSAATVFSRALIQKGADMSGRHVSTLATTLIASPLGESLATHLASASLLKMRASLIKTAVLQESGPNSGSPPAEPFANTFAPLREWLYWWKILIPSPRCDLPLCEDP